MALSFIHTADFQIGKAFGSIGGEPGTVLRRQRIEAVRRIAELAVERDVDAVLVAGDAFDFDTVGNETVYAFLQALSPYTGAWVAIPGNHDPGVPQSVWHRIEDLGRPANLRISLQPEVVEFAAGSLAVLTAPLQRRHENRDITFPWDALDTPAHVVRVGLAHGAVTTQTPDVFDASNPIAGDRETLSRLDYLALGDWHGTMQVGARTWYSGTPETDRFEANDSGNVLLVTIDSPGTIPVVEKIRVGHYDWFEVMHEINRAADVVALDNKLATLGESCHEFVVDLTLAGAVNLETRDQVERLLETWRGRMLCLREHADGLVARPTESDLDRIDAGGFVRAALERLQDAAANPLDPDYAYAADSIATLYRIHTAGSSQ